MFIHLKNLVVAVVPTETGNGIDQSSSLEDILACEETVIYSITDYFQAQNDEDIDLLHWSFLIDRTDSENYKNITGCNIEGVHQKYEPKFMERFSDVYKEALDFIISELSKRNEIIIVNPYDSDKLDEMPTIPHIGDIDTSLYKPYKLTKENNRYYVYGFNFDELGNDFIFDLDQIDYGVLIEIAHYIS